MPCELQHGSGFMSLHTITRPQNANYGSRPIRIFSAACPIYLSLSLALRLMLLPMLS